MDKKQGKPDGGIVIPSKPVSHSVGYWVMLCASVQT